MINYSTKDDKVQDIAKLNNLNDFKLKYNYRVYGLKQEDGKVPVLIEMVRGNSLKTENSLKQAAEFFKKKGIAATYQQINEGKYQIYIGLRLDLRQDLKLSNKILTTLVYAVENNVDLTKTKVVKKPKYS